MTDRTSEREASGVADSDGEESTNGRADGEGKYDKYVDFVLDVLSFW